MQVIVCNLILNLGLEPHIGHAYSLVLADALALGREKLLIGKGERQSVSLVCGTDEHGSKISKAAEALGLQESEFCKENREPFKGLASKLLSLEGRKLVHTSVDAEHRLLVQRIWNLLKAVKHIYKGWYSGWYSVVDECFVSEVTGSKEAGKRENIESLGIECVEPLSEPVLQPIEPSIQPTINASIQPTPYPSSQLVFVREENYIFNIRPFTERIRKWLREELELHPASLRTEVEGYLCNMQEISVSRQASSVPWASGVPGEEKEHTIYVWFDALVGYLAGWTGNSSNCTINIDTQVIGKDILKFHTVLFPAMLLALDLPLPRRIIAHAHWLSGGKKMSKSLGNVVDPFPLIEAYSADSLRYFLLKEAKLDADSVFSVEAMHTVHLNDLVNGFGNLYSRILNENILRIQESECLESIGDSQSQNDILKQPNSAQYKQIQFNASANTFTPTLTKFMHECLESYNQVQLHKVIGSSIEFVSLLNKHISAQEPWKMHPNSPHFHQFLGEMWCNLAVLASVMLPIMPEFCGKMLHNLCLESPLTPKGLLHIGSKCAFRLPLAGKFAKKTLNLPLTAQ